MPGFNLEKITNANPETDAIKAATFPEGRIASINLFAKPGRINGGRS